MRWTLAVAVLMLVAGGTFGGSAQAQDNQQSGPWCAYFTNGPTNCTFMSFEQCIEAIKGKTGLCNQNAHYAGPTDPSNSNGHRYARRRRSN
jgi:hypothetical protein